MRFLLTHLSFSYASRHKAKMLLTLLAVAVGVATFSAIRTAHEALARGIRATVDRMAGKAQLQISLEGGVPEEVQERIRDVPGVRATAPVIEQIVVPERAELGSLLVVGVDLLGDRELRDYGFEGADADIDDPLLFLAQPDSVALARPLAARAGVRSGESFSFRSPLGPKRVVVRGLLTPKGFAEAFGGNLVVTDVYAAQVLFGRGRRFDRVEVRLEEGVSLSEGTTALRAALGPAYRIETPDRRGAQLERLTSSFVAGFNISSGIALAIGTFLIWNAFQVSVNRRRRDIGTLRALGATPRQVQALFLLEAALLGLAGGALGLLLGAAASQSFLSMMGKTAENLYGVAGGGRADLSWPIVVQTLALGVIASLAGGWAPARAASRVSAVEAFAKGSHQARQPRRAGARAAGGLLLLACAGAVALRPPFGNDGTTLFVLVAGGAGLVLLVGPASRFLLRALAPLACRLAPGSGRLAADAILSNPRRTGGTVLATTLSLAFALGLGGHMGATKAAMMRWMEDALTSDLYVRASANWARPDFRLPATVRDELLRIPGVRAVESYRAARLDFRGEPILLATIEIGPMMDRTRRDFVEGDEQGMRRGVGTEGKCALSDNFARRFGLGVGDVVELPCPDGMVRLPVQAVTRDFSNDRGTVFIDRSTFLSHWKDDRVDVFDVNLLRGADPGRVRDEIRRRIGARFPALISTRAEFVAEIVRAIDDFFALIKITLLLALLVACLGIASSLLISVVERNRELGILKALGAVGGQLRRSVVFEGVGLGLVGLVLAVPAGNLLALFMEKVVAEAYSGWSMPHAYPWALLGTAIVALPVVAGLAAWVPARQAARVEAARAITYE
ncbi:MAG: FtsX-like permease family protein [Deltaproteobacteria bacterium]|nr:FtsX-like permease family protein [Deltaproteobacteria bacterium]